MATSDRAKERANYLQVCRREFEDLIRNKSGLPFNFREIEKSVACYRFEILIRELAIAHGMLGQKSRLELKEVIDRIDAPGIGQSRKNHWHDLRTIRNNLFHYGQQPTTDERDGLLSELKNLEDDVRRLGRSWH